MKYSYLLFDLDGTISDPLQGIWRCLNYALEYFGYHPLSEREAAHLIGPPLDEIFAAVAAVKDQSDIRELVSKYRERFGQVGYKENVLYPGIDKTIRILFESGVTMGICTSKRQDFAEQILTMFGIRDYFSFVSGGDIGIKKGEQIKQLLSDKTITTDALMIGDRAVDLIAAQQNKIESAGVLWGFGSRHELETHEPDLLFAKPEELKLLMK